jgi:hypothetical protein
MTGLALSNDEYKSIKAQCPGLVERLKTDLKGISQEDLSRRSVVAATQRSEIFQMFTGVSKYTCSVWNKSFAEDMANDASKAMTIDEIKAHPALYCFLYFMKYVNKTASVTDVDATNLRCIVSSKQEVPPYEMKHRSLTIAKLDDADGVKVSAKTVDAPTFAEVGSRTQQSQLPVSK